MTCEDNSCLIAGIAAFISLIALFVSVYFSLKAAKSAIDANNHAKVANDVLTGQAENELRHDIKEAKVRFEDICGEIEAVTLGREANNLTAVENKILEIKFKRMDSILEEYLNAYENACSKYIDKKIDVIRFKKMYVSEVRNLFEPPENAFVRLLHPEGTSNYKAIWKVYKEWNDHENN